MPCDDQSTDAYDMYNHVLNTVSLYCTNNNVDTYVLGGDFNTALNRETSRRTIALNEFVSDEYLYYCCLDASSNVTYTFFGPTGSKTLIDHFIVTVNISQYVSKYYTLDLIENISDHMPLYIEIVNHTPMISSTVDTCITPRVRALWSGASVDDITKYKQCVDLYLDYIYVPVESLLCTDYNCDNSYHCDELRLFFCASN